ncbi:MAG: carbamoyl phosphate synthase large subunit, partial [Actinomycetota bacterium]
FFSLADRDKPAGLDVARRLRRLGFELAATDGTAASLQAAGIPVATTVAKIGEEHDGRVDATGLIAAGGVVMVINTPRGRGARADGAYIRKAATIEGIPVITTMSAALAAVLGMADSRAYPMEVRCLQELHDPRLQLDGAS